MKLSLRNARGTLSDVHFTHSFNVQCSQYTQTTEQRFAKTTRYIESLVDETMHSTETVPTPRHFDHHDSLYTTRAVMYVTV